MDFECDAVQAFEGHASQCIRWMVDSLESIRCTISDVLDRDRGDPNPWQLKEIANDAKQGEERIWEHIHKMRDLSIKWTFYDWALGMANLNDCPEFPLRPGERTWTHAVDSLAWDVRSDLYQIEDLAAQDFWGTPEKRLKAIRLRMRKWKGITRQFCERWDRRVQIECNRMLDQAISNDAMKAAEAEKATTKKETTMLLTIEPGVAVEFHAALTTLRDCLQTVVTVGRGESLEKGKTKADVDKLVAERSREMHRAEGTVEANRPRLIRSAVRAGFVAPDAWLNVAWHPFPIIDSCEGCFWVKWNGINSDALQEIISELEIPLMRAAAFLPDESDSVRLTDGAPTLSNVSTGVDPEAASVDQSAGNGAQAEQDPVLEMLLQTAGTRLHRMIVKSLWKKPRGLSYDDLIEQVWDKRERRSKKNGRYEPPAYSTVTKTIGRIRNTFIDKQIVEWSIVIDPDNLRATLSWTQRQS